ncbi:DUF4212 domain-containing protein [Idiomarina sp.]|uniref:DUF4212 domain-containing protein n=1 Tax=Idiomarina sp. TaxID=1874361 RepID=UPI0025B815ED|nr:DUF4212 domain-containing protein [Idiomarina sp.]
MAFKNESDAKAYWKENLALMLKLLVVWFIVSYGFGILLVDVLNQITFFGLKLGFWFAQQGSILTFILLIFIYMKGMAKLDNKYEVHED